MQLTGAHTISPSLPNATWKLTSRVLEVQHGTVLFEHVDLLYTSDRLNVELAQSSLDLSVISLFGGSRLLDLLSSGCTLSTCSKTLAISQFVQA